MNAERWSSIMIEHSAEEAPKYHTLQSTGAAEAHQNQNQKTSILARLAAKARHAGGAILHVVASPGTLVFAGGAVVASVSVALAYQKHKKKRSSLMSTASDSSPPEQPRRSAPAITRSMSLAMLHGGENAMRRFMEAHESRLDSSKLSDALKDMKKELDNVTNQGKDSVDFNKLYVIVSRLEMSQQEDEAIKLLKEALKKADSYDTAHDTNMKHELEMFLVEMLIYKGDYEEAEEYLSKEEISNKDPRVPLYKATIYTMKGGDTDTATAKEHYLKFKEIRDSFYRPKFYKNEPSALIVNVPDYDDFKTIVYNLKKEIADAHQPKSTTNKDNQQDQGAPRNANNAN